MCSASRIEAGFMPLAFWQDYTIVVNSALTGNHHEWRICDDGWFRFSIYTGGLVGSKRQQIFTDALIRIFLVEP